MNEIKPIYIVDVDDNSKSGLFYSINSRISSKESTTAYNVGLYDSKIVSYIKIKCGIKPLKRKNDFYHGKNFYKAVPVKVGILLMLLMRFKMYNLYYKIVSYNFMKKCKNELDNSNVIIAHWGVTSGIIAMNIANIFKKKLSVTYHGSDIHTIPKKNKGIRNQILNLLNSSDLNIFVSKALRNEAVRLGYNKDNHTVLYNGVDRNVFFESEQYTKKALRTKLGILDNEKIIGFIGNLVDIKNAQILPEIFKNIFDNDENIRAIIIGKGEFFSFIQNEIDTRKVIMIPEVQHNCIKDYLSIFNLLILPSKNEGLPLIIAESLACSTPVVASNVGGISEILDKDNLVELNDQFVKNFSNKVLEKLDENSNVILDEKFNWTDKFEIEINEYLRKGFM
ncbi:glycosyltransferase [Vibrio parahaemolyticus]|nr:glycosyltransferase [Vibrio parahaemolyticus]